MGPRRVKHSNRGHVLLGPLGRMGLDLHLQISLAVPLRRDCQKGRRRPAASGGLEKTFARGAGRRRAMGLDRHGDPFRCE